MVPRSIPMTVPESSWAPKATAAKAMSPIRLSDSLDILYAFVCSRKVYDGFFLDIFSRNEM